MAQLIVMAIICSRRMYGNVRLVGKYAQSPTRVSNESLNGNAIKGSATHIGPGICISFDYQDFSVTVDGERVCIE